MPAKVVDASVLAALVFGEPRGEEAAQLLGGADLCAPPLLAYELASVARKKALAHPEQRERILQALEWGVSADIRWVGVDQVAVVSLALRAGLTTYDASYVYLAQVLGVPLATFDARLEEIAERG